MSIERRTQSPIDAAVRYSQVERVYDIGVRLTTIFLLGVAAFCAKTELDRVQDGEFWKPVPIEKYGEEPTPSQVKASEVAGYADSGMIGLGAGTLFGAALLEWQRRMGFFRTSNSTLETTNSSDQEAV